MSLKTSYHFIAPFHDAFLEDLLQSVPQLRLLSDEPSLANGWFRLIELKREQ